MAGDWVKVEHVTPDKPEISVIAECLDIDYDSVFGKLVRIWIWADQQSRFGHALSVTEKFIDTLTRQSGFAKAMLKAGWLTGESGNFSFPNFGNHNGQTAKARALASKRQRNGRVTQMSRSDSDKSVTREEKSIIKSNESVDGSRNKAERKVVWFKSLESVTTEHLTSTGSVCAIHRACVAEHPEVIRADEETLMRFLAAAIRDCEGDHKTEWFRGMIGKRAWGRLTGNQTNMARERLAAHRDKIQANGSPMRPDHIPLCDSKEGH